MLLLAALCVVLSVSCTSHAPTASATVGTTHRGRGVVVAVNVEKSRVKLNHEKIEGFMDAMTMWFDVRDATMLRGLAPNDTVEFTLTEEAAADVITDIRKVTN